MAEIQPSADYTATCMAVAWAIYQSNGVADREIDPLKIAKRVHAIYKVVALGRNEED